MIVEIQLAWNTDRLAYQQLPACEVLKGCISFITVMQLYYLYDYYDYVANGAKKEWFVMLYKGRNPGPCPGRFFTI